MTRPCVEPRAKEEAGCGASTGATAWGGDRKKMAWNAVGTGRDGVQAGCTTGVAARNNMTATIEVPRANEEAGCGAATGATEWGGVGATVACDSAAAGQDAASAGCLAGWWRSMMGRPWTRLGRDIHCRAKGAVCLPW